MRLLLSLLLLLTLLSPAYSQDIAKAKQDYKKQLDLITLKSSVARDKLKSDLGKALTALMETFQKSGNLSAWRAAEGAANAANSGTIPERTGDTSVDRYLVEYNRRASAIDHAKNQAIAGLNDAYKKYLGNLVKKLMQAGKIAEAETADLELKAVTEMTPNPPQAPIDKTPAPQAPVKPILGAATVAHAGRTASIKVTSARVRTERDSAGRKVHEVTVFTKQSRVEMWGTLTVHVQMTDKPGNTYFGSDPFPQRNRSSGKTSVAKWVFHVMSDTLDHPKLTGLWVIYRNNADPKNFDDKKTFVKVNKLEDWIKSNKDAKKLAVKGCYYQIQR
jgi:hypothetical protein